MVRAGAPPHRASGIDDGKRHTQHAAERDRKRPALTDALQIRPAHGRTTQLDTHAGERHYRTKALGYVRSVEAVNKLWSETGPRYA